MYQRQDLERIVKALTKTIEDKLSNIGIFFRIFYRIKSSKSLSEKVSKKGEGYYDGEKKFIRDIIGIRVVFYFADDMNIIYEKLKGEFSLEEETIDAMEETRFAPARINLVFKLPEQYIEEFKNVVISPLTDTTFEVQLRTILSEGWHEIDHDLRYKCQDDWNNNNDLSRNFNGILATLETSEYAILRLFEQLSYRHYKLQNLEAMLKTKFRIRFEENNIATSISDIFEPNDIKEIYKLNRVEVLNFLLNIKFLVPLSMDNFLHIINFEFLKKDALFDLCPKPLLEDLKTYQA